MDYHEKAERPEILGTFVFSVRTIRFPDGTTTVDVQAKNENVPVAIVLENARSWLKNNEQRYNSSFAARFGDALL